jgi:long-chain acyl-CoA synthetase
MFENLKTLVDVMYNSKNKYGNKSFLKYRENEKIQSISYNEFVDMVERLSASFYSIGIKKNEKVAIISENMYKWLITDMAIISLGAIDVPRGSDSTIVELTYILKHSDARYCIVEDVQQAEKVITILKNNKKIKHVILLNGEVKKIKMKKPVGLKLYSYDELLKNGDKFVKKYEKKLKSIRSSIKETDIVTIIYTSGTTGNPKGVMLTHKNIMQNVRSLPDVIEITDDERWLSVLPVWHVFERTLEYIIMATYGTMGYSKPVAKYLLPDFAEIKPTFMVAVPRIWEALCLGIMNNVKNSSKFRYALLKFFLKIGIIYTDSIKIIKNLMPLFKKPFILFSIFNKIRALIVIVLFWFLYLLGDILVFKKIRERTGGFLRGPISGGGALPTYVDKFYCAIGLEILEGWGLTETAPVIGVRTFHRKVPMTVGPPSPGIQIKIGDENGNPLKNQSEMGIVYIKGDNVMAGYYKDPEKTKAVISKDGWLNTGDLGRMTITGELQLTGRAKDTIVLIGGENVEPQPIEDKLLESPLIHQIMVVGQDKKVLGALIVPDEANLFEYADKNDIRYKNMNDLCNNETIINMYKELIRSKINSKNGFRDYERITYLKLLTQPFKPGDEMTHSLKIKRNIVMQKYNKEIEEMFK